MSEDTPALSVDRHWTVTVYVVFDGKVALRRHKKLGFLLAPGGHVEPGEAPDEAALREALEETGLDVLLVSADQPVSDLPAYSFDLPRQIARPLGIQITPVQFGHQHFDILFAAVPQAGAMLLDPFRWYSVDEAAAGDAPPDVVAYATAAIRHVERRNRPTPH